MSPNTYCKAPSKRVSVRIWLTNTTLMKQVNLKQEKKTKRLGLENASAPQYHVSKKYTISAQKSAMENRARDK